LARNFDLIIVDGLNPFGGGELLPLGRLREPLEGLRRGHAFVITRRDDAANLAAIEHVLRRYNPDAPIFHARTRARAWRNFSGRRLPPEHFAGTRNFAFCGLGNPQSFWRTLAGLGITPLEACAFEDHHRYRPVELRRLYARAHDLGAEFLLTTEKDAMNIAHPVEHLYWLEIELEVERMAELVQCVMAYTT
jgi:tetraacyldisaccharide 4'-kinase